MTPRPFWQLPLFCEALQVKKIDSPRLDLLNSVSAILLLHYGLYSPSNKVLLKYMLHGDERLIFEANQS